MSESESLSERELADVLAQSVYSREPRSVGEALAAADAEQPVEPEPVEIEEAPEAPPVVVSDEPIQPEAPEPEQPEEQQVAVEAVGEEPADEETVDVDEYVVWAKKKYGEDVPPKAARALSEQEKHISRLGNEKKELEQLASQWYEYAQQVEQAQPQVQMPLSSQEEAWADQAMANPVQYAAQAAMQGNMGLYNAIIERVAYQDPRQASAVETEVRLQMIAAAEYEQQQNGQQQPDLQSSLGAAVQRAGIDVQQYGAAMMEKIDELGEYSPYVQNILGDSDEAREMALLAVYDMVRAGNLTKRTIRDESREAAIQREAQLRKEAAGVVTGGASHNPGPTKPAFMSAMEAEWKARGQWAEE